MLFKYLPRHWAERFIDHGETLFRSLSYFRAVEHAARGDETEGVHIDAPDNDVTLETNTGIKVMGAFRFLNSVDQELTYAFCCSREFRDSLFDAFSCDSCVVITDPDTFFARCATAVRASVVVDRPGLLHRPVEYFAPNRPAPLDMKDPRALPFMKHEAFADQYEYRAVFARRGGFRLTERIVQPTFTFAQEIRAARQSERLLRLGDLRDCAEIRTR